MDIKTTNGTGVYTMSINGSTPVTFDMPMTNAFTGLEFTAGNDGMALVRGCSRDTGAGALDVRPGRHRPDQLAGLRMEEAEAAVRA